MSGMSRPNTFAQGRPGLAMVTHENPTKIPLLSVGQITPEIISDWADCCRQYFEIKNIAEASQVVHAAAGLKNPLHRNWYSVNSATLKILSFDEFLARFRHETLPLHWEENVRVQMMQSRQGARPFSEWATNIRIKNTVLRGTASALDDGKMKYLLEAGMNEGLRNLYAQKTIRSINVLKDWLQAVETLDGERLLQEREIARQVSLYQRGDGHQRQATLPLGERNRNVLATGDRDRLPPLTETEKKLLSENKGCYKCRQVFVDHMSKNCPDGAPSGKGYKPLTPADILNAKKGLNTRTAYDKGKARATAPVLEVPNSPAMSVIAAVMDEDVSAGDISTFEYAPIQSKHFLWSCVVEGPSGSSPPVSAMIDNGSPTVFIDEEQVKKNNLPLIRIRKPLKFRQAMDAPALEFDNVVKLRISSPSHVWTAKTVLAVVARDLCAPILLSLPWLKANSVIVDHGKRTCKAPDYDILLDKTTRKMPNPMPAQQKRKMKSAEIADTKKKVLCELKDCLQQIRVEVEKRAEKTSQAYVVSAIRDHVERLALADTLKNEDKQMKEKFADRFPADLPPVEDLPTDVYHRITLKDANRTFARRDYTCPRKYRDTWMTLIQQHLDAGHV